MKAIDVKLSGKISGTGFDYNTKIIAKELGVTGWITSKDEKSVLCHLEGDEITLEQMKQWFDTGNVLANIKKVKIKDSEVRGFDHFEQLINY